MNQWQEPYPANLRELTSKCEELGILFERKLSDASCPKVEDLFEDRNGRRFLNEANWNRAICFNDQAATTSFKHGEEMKGLYVFRESGTSGNAKPLYIGISRNVKNRLRQHAWGRLHNEATFAYIMARTEGAHTGSRDSIHSTPEILKHYQRKIQQYQVAILLEPNDYDLFFMEVYFAGKWKTPWNSFRTH